MKICHRRMILRKKEKMILIDYSGIALSCFMVMTNQTDIDAYDIGIFRHMVLNTIKKYNVKFKKDYGQLVLCADGKASWRKLIYPYYKANRKKSRDSSDFNWDKIYQNLNSVFEEIREYLQFVCIKIDNAEGDDIIAILSREPGKHIVVSNDKDMVQLYEKDRVLIYSNIKEEYVESDDVSFYIFEHICRGDTGDGVPNILSDDDTLIDPNKRQKSLYTKKIIEMYKDNSLIPDIDNFERNKKMIDLKEIPDDIQERVIHEYYNYAMAKKNKIMGYFIEKKLSKLLDSINDF